MANKYRKALKKVNSESKKRSIRRSKIFHTSPKWMQEASRKNGYSPLVLSRINKKRPFNVKST